MSYYIQVPLGPHLLLYGGTLESSIAIIWRNLWILISCYMDGLLGSQALLYKATHRSAQGFNNANTSNSIGGIGSVQSKIKLEYFEKLIIDSNSATPQTLIKLHEKPVFS